VVTLTGSRAIRSTPTPRRDDAPPTPHARATTARTRPAPAPLGGRARQGRPTHTRTRTHRRTFHIRNTAQPTLNPQTKEQRRQGQELCRSHRRRGANGTPHERAQTPRSPHIPIPTNSHTNGILCRSSLRTHTHRISRERVPHAQRIGRVPVATCNIFLVPRSGGAPLLLCGPVGEHEGLAGDALVHVEHVGDRSLEMGGGVERLG
jgi:hypothetical protein